MKKNNSICLTFHRRCVFKVWEENWKKWDIRGGPTSIKTKPHWPFTKGRCGFDALQLPERRRSKEDL